MPVYKHVAASQKRSKRKAEQLLSDEEDDLSASDNSDASQDDADSDSGSDQTDSDDDDSADEDDGLGGVDDVLGEDDPRPPPKGFPNALEALENQVVSSALLVAAAAAAGGESGAEAAKGTGADDEDDDDEELPLICVVCPNKVLKKGKMTDVHLASKDHKRRFARFSAHVQADDFPPEFALSDARWVSSQLDKAVIERLSMQTLVGGKKAGTARAPAAVEEEKKEEVKPATPAKKGKGKEKATTPAAVAASTSAPSSAAGTPAKASNAARKAEAVAVAEKEGISVREQLRRAKKDKEAKRAQRKKDKNERVKRRKLEKGEDIPARPPTKRFVEKVKPTEDEIAARQAWKKARDEAKAAGQPVPPRPVLAYEHGGKAPARLVQQHEQKKEAFEAKVKAKGQGGGGETRKRERKERRKDKAAAAAAAAAAKGDEVLAEV
ncbi:hypothetical protein JCM8208_005113 [Rhodotorula glutinis]